MVINLEWWFLHYKVLVKGLRVDPSLRWCLKFIHCRSFLCKDKSQSSFIKNRNYYTLQELNNETNSKVALNLDLSPDLLFILKTPHFNIEWVKKKTVYSTLNLRLHCFTSNELVSTYMGLQMGRKIKVVSKSFPITLVVGASKFLDLQFALLSSSFIILISTLISQRSGLRRIFVWQLS